MFPLLFAFVQPNTDLIQVHNPEPSYVLCYEMEHDIYQGVDFGIITQSQADALIQRCIVNYSFGPGGPHILS